ncbi:MAG: sigma-54-dependent Fis family transcriptional regulator [Proteobacteria bacterium]|nr:sigma-54-dependent Fis family transcriptional regulator [Pseudomonadota bacterium]
MEKDRILIVEDDDVGRKNLVRILSKRNYHLTSAKDGTEALSYLAKHTYDLILTDLIMKDIGGLDLLTRAKLKDPEVEVILVTAYSSVSTAIEAIKKGAYHYLEKPFRPEDVQHIVAQAVEKRRLRKTVLDLEKELKNRSSKPQLIGESAEIREVVKTIKQVAPTDCNVLLTGESGTGKELVASMIHGNSRRSKERFLAINCGGFAEELLANELFGHEKDAFTGATSERAGLFESASRGTLFLDEIGDMPLSMQIKLLRVIQEQEVIRVGGNQPVAVDVRIVAATNKDLKKAVGTGLFRKDLYYRLNVVSVFLPPLRDRLKDVPLLAHLFLEHSVGKSGKAIKGFSEKAMKTLVEYNYPGNTRELENIVERATAMTLEDTIQVYDLPPDLYEMNVYSFSQSDPSIKTLKEIQREYVQWVLNRCGRKKGEAAKRLGIDRSSLWRYLKRQEIEE